jgi:hypothetical protein
MSVNCRTKIGKEDICKEERYEESHASQSARRVIKPWTKEDVRSFKAHSKARTPVAKISKEMKRTVGALRRRAGILGVGLGRYH